MVATSQPMATFAGLDVLRRGGNAMDAAIAAGATLCVTEPQSTGIGGDCFILYHHAASNTLYGINGSGRAPARATLDEFRKRGYTRVPERGMLAVTVPGAVHAWHTALERFGSMSFNAVLAPAVDFAEQGYGVTPVVADSWARDEAVLAAHADARECLLVEGRAPLMGTLHRQPKLARTLRLIGAEGPDVFYKGEIAREIVRFSQRNDGLVGLDDFADHRSEWVEPIHATYRGLRIYEIPPNGQGITALMMLNILQPFDLKAMEHLGAEHVHTIAEAFRLARAERDRFVCDPAFVDIPVADLLSADFAKAQSVRIDASHALAHPVVSGLPEHKDTVYLTVVDEERNAVSLINSLYYPWGSGMVVGSTGVTLQNRAAGFNLQEGHSNCIAPRKRPMHTIIPAMVYAGDRPVLSFGVMGGQYQAMGHSYVLSNWRDFGMDLQEAVDAARFLPEEDALVVERSLSAASRAGLKQRGHNVVEAELPLGGAQCILIDWEKGVLQAASDGRKDGCALGY
jgi:gamma-glutamyltranspeptidase/glutathione hydrolase